MFRTKRSGGQIPAAWAFMILAALVSGCADGGGLRSVWPNHPSLLGFRDRKPKAAAPDPADDSYARAMHGVRDRSTNLARRPRTASPEMLREREGEGPPAPDETLLADSAETTPPRRPSRPRTEPAEDDSIRVTLGAPEPIAGSATSNDPPADRLRTARERHTRPAPEPESAPVEETPAPVAVAVAATSRPAVRPQPSRTGPSAKEDPRAILARAEAKLQSLDTYQVRMQRIERVGGKLQPEEEVLLSVHQQPREVRLSWDRGPSQGREVIYSTRIDNRSLFVHMPKSAIPLPTMKMAIDSPMVMKSSKHSIAEAGFDTIVQSLHKSIENGSAAYRGIEKPPGMNRPSHVFTRRLSNGETWTVFLDTQTLFPSMVVAKNSAGELDEKYIYHEVVENPTDLAAADAFDPDRRWGSAKGGLLSRFARGGPAASGSKDGTSTVR